MQQAFWAWWSPKTYIPGTNLSASFIARETPAKRLTGSVRGDTMKVLLCLCACVAAAAAHGVIGYPVAPLAYHTIAPVATVARPFGVTYHGLPPLPYFSYNLIPSNLVFSGVPGLVHYVPLVPADGKGKPDKKKPGGEKDDKDKKEETTEEPTKEEDGKTEEPEDLAR